MRTIRSLYRKRCRRIVWVRSGHCEAHLFSNPDGCEICNHNADCTNFVDFCNRMKDRGFFINGEF